MKIVITKYWSIGKCTNCGNLTKVRLLITTGGLFKVYCNGCETWQDFKVIAQDIEYEEAEEDIDVD